MEKKIAKDLLSIGAVFLRPEQPFTWASGIKSPIYCDNRLTLTAPVVSLFYKRTTPSSRFQPEGVAPSSKGKDKEQEGFFPCVACPYSIARFFDMGK